MDGFLHLIRDKFLLSLTLAKVGNRIGPQVCNNACPEYFLGAW